MPFAGDPGDVLLTYSRGCSEVVAPHVHYLPVPLGWHLLVEAKIIPIAQHINPGMLTFSVMFFW